MPQITLLCILTSFLSFPKQAKLGLFSSPGRWLSGGPQGPSLQPWSRVMGFPYSLACADAGTYSCAVSENSLDQKEVPREPLTELYSPVTGPYAY